MNNANDHFSQYTGTQHYYKHFTGILYTDGVKAIAEHCSAYWLIDLIVSWQVYKKVNRESFQQWKLYRVAATHFKVIATDGNNNLIASQDIPFSDFPFDSCSLWLCDQIILLPSEY
jgi:hypothetical protein